ncbi:hypothetical protein OROGR_008667 [Orobanche gracilis]
MSLRHLLLRSVRTLSSISYGAVTAFRRVEADCRKNLRMRLISDKSSSLLSRKR